MSWLKFEHQEEEAAESAQEVLRVQKYTHGLLHNDDFAILVRNNFQSRSFEQALSKLQIPYRMVRFVCRKILKYKMMLINSIRAAGWHAFL
jgi:superfamily I DNA/RNA helicase